MWPWDDIPHLKIVHLRDNDFVFCYYFQVMSFPQIVNCVIGNKVIQQVGVLKICLDWLFLIRAIL